MHARHAARGLPDTPQAGRIETANDNLPLRNQHPLNLTQDLMRLGRELQYVRQHHQIQALRGKRQFRKIVGYHHAGLHLASFGQTAVCQPLVAHPVRLQGFYLRHADLHCVEAEDIRRHRIQPRLLPLQHVTACGRLQPGAERYNGLF